MAFGVGVALTLTYKKYENDIGKYMKKVSKKISE